MDTIPFLTWLAKATLMGSLLVGVILLVKRLFRFQLSAGGHYILWFLLVFRLLMPIAPESPFSLYNLIHFFSSGQAASEYFNGDPGPKYPSQESSINSEKVIEDFTLSVDKEEFPNNIVLLIWLTGAIILILKMLAVNLSFRSMIKKTVSIQNPEIIAVFETCKKELNIKGSPLLVESALIDAPMFFGVIKPTILLPAHTAAALDLKQVRYIILHELGHYQRRDMLVNWLLCLLQILHWFNPIIWYAFHYMRLDREAACDATVLSKLEPQEYKFYGAAIISFLERYSQPMGFALVSNFVNSKNHVKSRITMISRFTRESMVKRMCLLFLMLIMGCTVLTNAKDASGIGTANAISNLSQVKYEDLGSYFEDYSGSFVLYDLSNDCYHIYNPAQSQERFSPCSTYKIVSSLIGLETGVIEDENTLIKWDGTIYPYEPWNKDQTLSSAMNLSVSWYFQNVDQRVGKEQFSNYLRKIDYGNNDLTAGINDFWLESSLKISPVEQVQFLKKLYTYEIPIAPKNIDKVKNVIKLSVNNGVSLSGKTATGIVNNKTINGWFIGYVEKDNHVYFFATNIQGKNNADGANAKKITLSILKEKKFTT